MTEIAECGIGQYGECCGGVDVVLPHIERHMHLSLVIDKDGGDIYLEVAFGDIEQPMLGNNKYIGATPAKISRVLELISNDEEYPDIDIILEAGLGTVYTYSNNPQMLISEGTSSVLHLEEGDPTTADTG